MFLKMIKLAAMLVSVMFISPMIKYQPDILKAAHEREVETESAMTQEIMITGTVAQSEETKTKEPFVENSVSEKKEMATEREVSEKLESITEASNDAATSSDPELPDTVTEPESETEVESESVSESTVGTIASESSESESENSIATEPSTEHQHTWIPVTEAVHHEEVYQTIHHEEMTEHVWIEDKPAWDETYENTYIVAIHAFCRGCGMDLNEAGMTDEEHDAHDLQHILNGEDSGYYEAPIYETVTETIHHEAEGHYEDRVVREAFDESVLVSEAWDEEVITGYVCEECGEVK